MVRRYIKRSLEPVLKRAAREFPAVVLTGPRQSGKTTLLERLFTPTFGYVSIESPDVGVEFGDSHLSLFKEISGCPELPMSISGERQPARRWTFWLKRKGDSYPWR